jgi:hypothetical protein
MTFNINVECQTAFASKPAPTGPRSLVSMAYRI